MKLQKTQNDIARSLDIHHKYTDRLQNYSNDKQMAG